MPDVRIKFGAGLTPEQSRACFSAGQRRWWIARVSGTRSRYLDDGTARFDKRNIVKYLPLKFGPATYPLDCTVNIDFGCYVLGCGTGKAALRKFFAVDLMGVKWL